MIGPRTLPIFIATLSPSDINNRPIFYSSSRIPLDSVDVSDGKRIKGLGSSQSECCSDLGLPDELVLYTSKHDLYILDPKSQLNVLCTEKDIVCKVDTRRFLAYEDFDRLNMVEVRSHFFLSRLHRFEIEISI